MPEEKTVADPGETPTHARSEDIVERVARSLWVSGCRDYIGGFHSPPSWEEAHAEDREHMRNSAVAAIEAIGLTTSSGTAITAEMIAIITNALWRPIASAPKDGRPLMIEAGVVGTCDDPRLGKVEAVFNRWEQSGFWDRAKGTWVAIGGGPIPTPVWGLNVEALRWRHPTEAEYLEIVEQKEAAIEHG